MMIQFHLQFDVGTCKRLCPAASCERCLARIAATNLSDWSLEIGLWRSGRFFFTRKTSEVALSNRSKNQDFLNLG